MAPGETASSADARRLLVIFAGDLASARRKGVEHLLLHYDEGGYFDKVVLVSPYLRRDARVVLDSRHELLEFGLGRARLVRRLLAPLHVLRLILACRRIVRREGIKVIRGTEPTLCGLVAWATSRLTGVPYVVSLHADYDKRFALDGGRGAPTLFGSRRLVQPLERLTLRGAALVLPIRESLISYAAARGVSRDRIRVIPHGIDEASFTRPVVADVRQALGLPADRAIVAFVGRLSAENYVKDLLDAARLLAERRDDFVVVLAGGGVLEADVRARLAADPLLAGVVRPVGFQSRDTVRALQSAAAVSVCLMGGFGLIEACAAGRPVVAYDVEWHHELVIDGSTGRLLPEHDVPGVTRAIAAFVDDPALAERMGREARRLAWSRHRLADTQRVKRQVYGELLESEKAVTINDQRVPSDLGRPGAAPHWIDGNQFAAQCDPPGTRAAIEQRWRVFADVINSWRLGAPDRGTLQVLDAGCGDGINLEPLSRILRAHSDTVTLLGLDYNPRRLQRAKALGVTPRLVHASLTQAPFDDATFDVVLCNHVIEHLREPGSAAHQIARLLRPGGLAIIGVPNEGCVFARLRNHVLQRSILTATDHVNFFTRDTLTRLLEKEGLSVLEMRTEGFFVPHLRLLTVTRASRLGRSLLEAARRLLPSQAAGLIAVATRRS